MEKQAYKNKQEYQFLKLKQFNINKQIQISLMKQIDGYKIYMNQKLGQGSFGAVYKGISDKTGQKVAIKILSKQSIDADEYLKNALFSQIKIMESVKSENIVSFYDVMESSKNYYIVQELCDGDLSSVLKHGNTVNQETAKKYLLQMANGCLALVRQGIIHRDLKPANIMMKGNQLKLGDFGFAKKSQAASRIKNQTIVGSPLYMSLQILKSQSYSSKCDIWALGYIFYEMLHGQTPWTGKSQFDLIKNIQKKSLYIQPKFSNQTKDFLKKCLQLTEERRISWDQLFVHPIFNGYFVNKSKGNLEFENKLKMIMGNLRFQINSNNIDLCKILANLGYKDGTSELNKQKFFQFLRIVDDQISRQSSDYIFAKTDYDRNGTISINEIQKIMNQNNIVLSTINQKVPGFVKNQGSTQSFTTLSPTTQAKIKTCFGKIAREVMINKSTLKQVFDRFDKEKRGSLDKTQFRRFLKAMSKDLQMDQIDAAFDLVDADGSQTVQFEELNNYYRKVNGITSIDRKNSSNSDRMDEQKPKNPYNMYSNNNSNMNGQYQNPFSNSNNPFGALMGNQGGGYYMPPPPPQMYYQPNINYYNQPQPPPQKGGAYDGFVMNMLYNKSNNNNNGW